MSSNAKIVESQRKANLQAQEIELFKQSFVIVPYQVSGFIDNTNRGVRTEVVNPDDFETFKRVWTGNDACNLNWKSSISCFQNITTKKLEVKFQLGEVFLGVMETNDNENVIGKDKSFSDYTSQEIESTLTFRVSKYFDISDYYQLMFYKIPEISGSVLFRITNIEKDYIGRELIGYVITFKSINQELANTGRARQQNIMPNSPGQGYLECVVKDSNWPNELGKEEFDKLVDGVDYYKFFDRYITADYQKTLNRPAKKMVVRMFGVGVLGSVSLVGRPAIEGEKLSEFEPQRLIFPYNLKTPSTYNFFNSQGESNNYYFGEFYPTLKYWKELMASIKDSLTPVNKFNYEGFLEYDEDKLKATNPSNGSLYLYELFGKISTNQEGQNFLEPWSFSTDKKEISMLGLQGVENKYNIGGYKKVHNHLFDNYWTQKQMKALPVEVNSSLTFGNTLQSAFSWLGKSLTSSAPLLPLIYGVGLFAIGISGAFTGKYKLRNCPSFRGLINAPFTDFNSGIFGRSVAENSKNKMPFNSLNCNSAETPNTIFYDGATLSTGFEASLTDLIQTPRAPNKILSTLNIGQSKDEDGNDILQGQPFLLNGDAELYDAFQTRKGYIIDAIQIQAIFNGEISIEFLDVNDDVIWSGVYQSEGKWTNSMREIWTEKNCSVFGRENMFYSEPLPYPAPLPPAENEPEIYGREEILLPGLLATASSTMGNQFYIVNGQVLGGDITSQLVRPIEESGVVTLKKIKIGDLIASYDRFEVHNTGGMIKYFTVDEVINNKATLPIGFNGSGSEGGYYQNFATGHNTNLTLSSYVNYTLQSGDETPTLSFNYDKQKEELYFTFNYSHLKLTSYSSVSFPSKPSDGRYKAVRIPNPNSSCGITKVVLVPK